MKDIPPNNYYWLDIIEPITKQNEIFSIWEYFGIVTLIIITGYATAKYFKMHIRLNLLWVSIKLKNHGNTRKCAKTALDILSKINSKPTSLKEEKKRHIINKCQYDLLEICYSKKSHHSELLQAQLIKLNKLI